MPYPNHSLLVFGGSWTNAALSVEIWTTSVRLTAGFTGGPPWEDLVVQAAAKVETFFQSQLFNQQCRCEYVKLNPIGPDGRYAIEDETYEEFLNPPVIGAMAGALLPLQNTVVATLETERSRGIASKGRMFLPGVTQTQLNNSGFLSPSVAQGIADGVAAFLIDLQTWEGDFNGVPAVVSQGANGGAGEGAAAVITSVSVGNVVDTQRRRRNALSPEERVFADVPLP